MSKGKGKDQGKYGKRGRDSTAASAAEGVDAQSGDTRSPGSSPSASTVGLFVAVLVEYCRG